MSQKIERPLNLKWRFLVLKWVFLTITGLVLFTLGLQHGMKSRGTLEGNPIPK